MTDAISPTYFQELLAPACETLYGLLEESADITDTHFRQHGIPAEQWFGRTHLVRAHFARRIEVETPEGFTLRDTRNNGRVLLLAPDGSSLRVLHAGPRNTVPAPGPNQARIRYYRQQQLPIPGLFISRLLALWSVTLDGAASVRIVRPIGRWKYGQKAMIDVDFVLPRTAEGMAGMEFIPDDSEVEIVLPAEEETRSPEFGEGGAADPATSSKTEMRSEP